MAKKNKKTHSRTDNVENEESEELILKVDVYEEPCETLTISVMCEETDSL